MLNVFKNEGDHDEDFTTNIVNVVKDLLAPYGDVKKIINKKGFYTEIINTVGIYRADDVIRCFNSAEYGSEIVFISIYPNISKYRFYGWWAPIEIALAIIGMAMADKELLPKRLSVLLVNGARIEEEIMIPDYYGEEQAKKDYLRHNEP